MKISKIRVQNYKGFVDSGDVVLPSGFNLIVGQNNSGKTAMLEAATARFKGNANRNPRKTDKEIMSPSPSVVSLAISLSGGELERFIYDGLSFRFPKPPEITVELDYSNIADYHDQLSGYMQSIFGIDELAISVDLEAANGKQARIKAAHGPEQFYKERMGYIEVSSDDGETLRFHQSGFSNRASSSFGWSELATSILSSIYHFEAERVDLSWSPVGQSSILRSNGENLAEVLNRLQGRDPHTFARYNNYVSKIFPSVNSISVVSEEILNEDSEGDDQDHDNDENSGQNLEILVWPQNGRSDRPELSIPMNQCGTGVGQVLAILYVVVTSRTPKLIIIDEPNSFLHPGATRKLVELLRRDFSRHQYLVSTHSAEVIRSADPSSVTLIKWAPDGSTAEQFNAENIHKIQAALSEVGVKMSDVFGADSIVWVEGPTEEESIHEIFTRLITPPILNTSVIPVVSTGDFESRKIALPRIIEIYRRFSVGNSLIPPTVAFIFDSEGRRSIDIEDAKRQSGGTIKFLPRRMFENYLLDGSAIDAVLRDFGGGFGYEGNAVLVKDWISVHGLDKEFLPGGEAGICVGEEKWLNVVHGAILLKRLFQHFMGAKLEFSKTTHSTALCRWLIENNPSYLDDLAKFLENVVRGPKC